MLLLLVPCASLAQSRTQLWSEVRLDWIKSRQFIFAVDFQPKVLVSAPAGDPGWTTLDVTPSVDYSRGKWLDVVAEMLVGRTQQTDDLDSTASFPTQTCSLSWTAQTIQIFFRFMEGDGKAQQHSASGYTCRLARYSARAIISSSLNLPAILRITSARSFVRACCLKFVNCCTT